MFVSYSIDLQQAAHMVESEYFGTDALDVEAKTMEEGLALYLPRKRQEDSVKDKGPLIHGNEHCFVELVANSSFNS